MRVICHVCGCLRALPYHPKKFPRSQPPNAPTAHNEKKNMYFQSRQRQMLSTTISWGVFGSSIGWECNPLPCEGQCRRHFQQMACFENPPKQTALMRCRTCNPDHACQAQLPASPRSIPWCARALDGVAGPTPRFSFLGGRSPLAEPQSHRV